MFAAAVPKSSMVCVKPVSNENKIKESMRHEFERRIWALALVKDKDLVAHQTDMIQRLFDMARKKCETCLYPVDDLDHTRTKCMVCFRVFCTMWPENHADIDYTKNRESLSCCFRTACSNCWAPCARCGEKEVCVICARKSDNLCYDCA